MIVLIIFV